MKRLEKFVPGLPLLAIAFIPFGDMEIWRRAIILASLAATYYAMTKMEIRKP